MPTAIFGRLERNRDRRHEIFGAKITSSGPANAARANYIKLHRSPSDARHPGMKLSANGRSRLGCQND
jgi:hypothetical protein